MSWQGEVVAARSEGVSFAFVVQEMRGLREGWLSLDVRGAGWKERRGGHVLRRTLLVET
jgi:hypothetical protein